MLIQPTKVKFHLTFIGRFEIAELQFDRHKPSERSMEKEQIEVVIIAVHLDSFLPGNERESSAQFQKKLLEFP